MSIGGNDYSWAPRDREQVRSSQFEFQTYASSAFELAPSLCIPPASKVLPSVARSAQQEDRASILDRIIAFCVASIFGIIGAGSLIIGSLYWFV